MIICKADTTEKTRHTGQGSSGRNNSRQIRHTSNIHKCTRIRNNHKWGYVFQSKDVGGEIMTDCRLCEHYQCDMNKETRTMRVWCNKVNITNYYYDCPYFKENHND